MATFRSSRNQMPVILSLILFFFRSIFLLGIEVSDALYFSSTQEEEQLSFDSKGFEIHPFFFEDTDSDFLLIENQEKEEKSESENTPLLLFVETAVLPVSKKDYIDWQTSFFSSKSKLGGVFLYDLFSSWKTHLS